MYVENLEMDNSLKCILLSKRSDNKQHVVGVRLGFFFF